VPLARQHVRPGLEHLGDLLEALVICRVDVELDRQLREPQEVVPLALLVEEPLRRLRHVVAHGATERQLDAVDRQGREAVAVLEVVVASTDLLDVFTPAVRVRHLPQPAPALEPVVHPLRDAPRRVFDGRAGIRFLHHDDVGQDRDALGLARRIFERRVIDRRRAPVGDALWRDEADALLARLGVDQHPMHLGRDELRGDLPPDRLPARAVPDGVDRKAASDRGRVGFVTEKLAPCPVRLAVVRLQLAGQRIDDGAEVVVVVALGERAPLPERFRRLADGLPDEVVAHLGGLDDGAGVEVAGDRPLRLERGEAGVFVVEPDRLLRARGVAGRRALRLRHRVSPRT
jgi:hypothetical protein